MKYLIAPFAVGTMLATSQAAQANQIECYDVKVRAKPVEQIPTEFPDEEDYIVLSWPWFVDLRVKRVLEGDLDEKETTALAVLHSAYLRKTRTFLLRRNDLHGFNVLRTKNAETVRKCGEGVGPANAYIRPADGETLEDYRRAGEEE